MIWYNGHSRKFMYVPASGTQNLKVIVENKINQTYLHTDEQ